MVRLGALYYHVNIKIIPATKVADGVIQSSLLMQEVAAWLIKLGKPMWELAELSPQALLESYKPGDIYLGLSDGEACLTFVLQEEDPVFWPGAAPGEALYIHKLSTARKYKAQGFTEFAIGWCRELAYNKKKRYLRLDCDPNRQGLVDLYAACGFKQTGRRFVGPYDTAFFEMAV